MNDNADHLVIEKVLAGDLQAYGELVERYQDFVFTNCLRILKSREEAEEVAQDSFLKAFHSLKSFRGDSKFSTWLYRIAYHKSLDKLKKLNREQHFQVVEEITESDSAGLENGLDCLLREERLALVEEAVKSLPEIDAAIINYYYFDELPVKEIATITALSEDNIKIRLYRGRKQLFSYLKQYINPEISRNNGKAI
ncbi:RNA polymerase sigma factor [Christiangramia flava]|uniref:RNA polymerase sigma factor n=1 Tax=Christiangramia flava JLT2011 TaxID=1229726 RepID=A0A1L7I645_9FLAO|nr:RNA polymerase sigma factor [Christiangramia flava]APU69077.1 RNA polymerase sigma-70 factor, ECF subfamily [Christiangramia flava JLT2011]OSS38322.1 RNA polymerase sigma factor RpoE [Christiangramia flava JLT2011]